MSPAVAGRGLASLNSSGKAPFGKLRASKVPPYPNLPGLPVDEPCLATALAYPPQGWYAEVAAPMNLRVILIIGAIMGALDGVGIFFAPEEPYQVEIFIAAILKGLLVSLITGLSLSGRSRWWQGLGYGALYGFAFALVVFLAKGGFKSLDAPYVVPSGLVMGALTGLLVVKLAFRAEQKATQN